MAVWQRVSCDATHRSHGFLRHGTYRCAEARHAAGADFTLSTNVGRRCANRGGQRCERPLFGRLRHGRFELEIGDTSRLVRAARLLEIPHAREKIMGIEGMAPETAGVRVELLAALDLGPEIRGMEGRQLRMRMVTIEPGGVFGPLHDHRDRPGLVYILQGTITDHRDGVATDYGPGLGWPEDRDTVHWLENKGALPAVEISVDIVRE